MAIKLAKVLDNGFEANYWRVLTLQADADTKIVNGMVALYKNKASRLAGNLPADNILYNFRADTITGNLVSLVYDHLKSGQLNGGEDD